jgi:hypothetical protein
MPAVSSSAGLVVVELVAGPEVMVTVPGLVLELPESPQPMTTTKTDETIETRSITVLAPKGCILERLGGRRHQRPGRPSPHRRRRSLRPPRPAARSLAPDLLPLGEPSLYLGILPRSTDGIDYWNLDGAQPPALVVEQQG